MTDKRPGYFARLLSAFLGRWPKTAEPVTPSDLDEELAGLRAQGAALQMDLKERDERIGKMKAEYEALKSAKGRAAAGAAEDQLERLFKRLAGPLSNLAALTSMAEAGQEVEFKDLIQLIRSLEKQLAQAGLEPIGRVGQETRFDVACHQRMSGGAVREGAPVTVQLPGYRLGENVLVKAMVSAREDRPEEGQRDG